VTRWSERQTHPKMASLDWKLEPTWLNWIPGTRLSRISMPQAGPQDAAGPQLTTSQLSRFILQIISVMVGTVTMIDVRRVARDRTSTSGTA
jgi:hypothetical protein